MFRCESVPQEHAFGIAQRKRELWVKVKWWFWNLKKGFGFVC